MINRVEVICGAYNGRSPRITAQIKRTERYIDHIATKWTGDQESFNKWAVEVMQGCLRGIAEHLCADEVNQN